MILFIYLFIYIYICKKQKKNQRGMCRWERNNISQDCVKEEIHGMNDDR